MTVSEAYGDSKVDKIIAITEKLSKIDRAIETIRYNNELYTEIPEVVKTLGAAKDACIAELKTV